MGQKIILRDRDGRFGDLCKFESYLRESGIRCVVGVDEAGRGPIAGPVVAAAVYLPTGVHIEGLADSKKMTPAKREEVFDLIVTSEASYAVGIVDNELIDRINILRASLRAMGEAISKLSCHPEVILVDGRETIPSVKVPQIAVVGGDAHCPSVSAASIIAKVTRDRIMDHYQGLYRNFSFNKHKGYPTADHLRELKLNGPCPIHRRSYRPVQDVILQTELIFD